MIAMVDDPQAYLKMLDYAIKHWNTPNRDKALEVLAQNEDRQNQLNGFSGLDDELDDWDDDEEVLGRLFKRKKKKGRVKGFFKKIKKAVKNVGKGLKKVLKTVVRFNPLSIAARNGFLIALKLNIKKMASKLKWAYATKQQAAKKGINEKKWNQSKSALDKVEKLFADKLQGKRSALKKAILKGKAGNLNGVIEDDGELAGLGEPVTAATAATMIATATPIIVSVIKILKKSGVMNPNESEAVNVSEDEIKAGASSRMSQNYSSESEGTDESGDFDFDENSDGDDAKPKNSAIAFLKNNPMVAVGGLAAIGGIGYMLLGKKKAKGNLKGVEKKKPRKKKNVTKRKRPNKKKKAVRKLQTIKLS